MDQAEQLRNIIKANNAMGQATGNVPKRPLARVITVTSGKGGVGKSNTAINLAIQFRKMGQKVIILDADFGLANIEIMFGAVPKHNLCDLIYQGKNIREIITWGPMDVGFISGGSGIAGMSNLSREYLVYIIKNLAELDAIADVIIVDTGAGISDAVLEFLVASGEILLVTTPEPTSITDAYALLKALNRKAEYSKENTTIKIISNKAKNDAEGQSIFEKMSVVAEKFLQVPLVYIGAVPMDTQIPSAVMRQKPLSVINPDAAAARAIRQLARKLLEIDSMEESKGRGISKLFSDLIKNKKAKR